MGLFGGNPVDAMAISQEMRKAVRLWETCYILIINPGVGLSNFKSQSNETFVWSGMARYQPYRKDVMTPQVANPTITATARFQIDFDADGPIPHIKPNYRVWVVPAAMAGVPEYPDPYISEYDSIVTSALNSSLAWIRTIETITNVERLGKYEGSFAFDGTTWSWV